jgi:transmembrane 9 superfamily protein 2/4
MSHQAVLCMTLSMASAFYLPGIAPKEYPEGAALELKVNKLTSAKAQLPYGYYTLPYCKPEQIQKKIENLGELLAGDDIENSPYEINMLINATCKKLCTEPMDKAKKEKFRRAIDDNYMVNWIIDNLPGSTKYLGATKSGQSESLTLPGFPVGTLQDGRYFVHNHVTLRLAYHVNPELYNGNRFVGFDIEPQSLSNCQDSASGSVDLDGAQTSYTYTYDVKWSYSEIRWVSRWDVYLQVTGGTVHWFSILNSMLIVLLLSGMVAMTLLRTLFRDIAKYNELATEEEAKEETGWKLVHGDVFRAPTQSKLLAVSVGSGIQILGMAVVTLCFALLGFLSPANRGGLLQAMMLVFTFMGILGGFVMSRFYKIFGKSDQRLVTLLMAGLYPGLVFLMFFFLDMIIWHQGSSGAVPFTTMLAMLVLWFGVSVPLVFLGAHVGFNRPAIELPVRINPIPRSIPAPGLLSNRIIMAMVGGVLPFGAIFTELFFIMSSLWHHRFYYMFGFLGIVLVLLVITCSEISIALTYFQLTLEDYHWWWRAFFTSGASAAYVFMYSILYFNTRLEINSMVATVVYFGYMAIISLLFFLLTGSIGLLSSFLFVRAIYGTIKVD